MFHCSVMKMWSARFISRNYNEAQNHAIVIKLWWKCYESKKIWKTWIFNDFKFLAVTKNGNNFITSAQFQSPLSLGSFFFLNCFIFIALFNFWSEWPQQGPKGLALNEGSPFRSPNWDGTTLQTNTRILHKKILHTISSQHEKYPPHS